MINHNNPINHHNHNNHLHHLADESLVCIERFVDKNSNVAYKRNNSGAMRPILPRNKTMIRPEQNKIAASECLDEFKETKDLVEWNKYVYRRKRVADGEISLSEYVFEDRDLYDFYVGLCERRDRIPELPKERIDELKNRDPIFSKRHRQYEAAKLANKAPLFDANDFFLPRFIPKVK
jgi:hypothetical protein